MIFSKGGSSDAKQKSMVVVRIHQAYPQFSAVQEERVHRREILWDIKGF